MSVTISNKEFEEISNMQMNLINITEENVVLKVKVVELEETNIKLSDKIRVIVEKALPICDEINESKGFFRFIKVIKLTVKLVELIQANFTPLR